MKAAITTALLLTAFAVQAAKDEKLAPIPKEKEGRWGIYSYDEAKQTAAKKKRPIALIIQEERTEEVAEKEAAVRGFWAMEKDCVVVMVNSRLLSEAKTRIGVNAHAVMTSKVVGKAYPSIIVMDQTGEKYLGHMTKDQIIAADEKVLKSFAKEVEDFNKDPSKAPPAPVAATPAAPAAAPAAAAPAPAVATGPVAIKEPKVETWTNAQGKPVQAAVTEITPDKVSFKLPDGRVIPYDISNLSEESKKRLDELKAANAQ
ncbi:MAG: hypothetical protein ACOYMN_03510 [Roseimicrobium sp.]